MPDEYANVTVKGRTFDVRVPKGSSDEYVQKAAQDYYNQKYASESGPSLPKVEAPLLSNLTYQKMAQTGGEGEGEPESYLGALGRSASKIGEAIMHPLDTIRGAFPATEQFTGTPHEQFEQFSQGIRHLPLEDEIFKATHGNIPGALGDVTIPAALATLISPRIRGGISGGGRGLVEGITDSGISAKRNSVPAMIGGAIGAHSGGWPGFLTGTGIGAVIPELPRIMRSAGEGAVEGMTGKPLFPQIIGDIPNKPITFGDNIPRPNLGAAPRPNEYPQIPGRVLVTPPPEESGSIGPQPAAPSFNPQIERGPINMPGPGLDIPPQQPRLGPATQTQVGPIPPNVKGLLNPGSFWRGPGSINPNFDPASLKMPDVPEPKVSIPPKEETLQVPPVTKSVTQELPSSKALNITPEETFGPETKKVLEDMKKDSKKGPKLVETTPDEEKIYQDTVKEANELNKESIIEKLSNDFDEEEAKRLFEKYKDPTVEHPDKSDKSKLKKTKKSEEPIANVKPHLTHEILGKFKDDLNLRGKTKYTLTEVARALTEEGLASENPEDPHAFSIQPSKFGKNWGSGRTTKIPISDVNTVIKTEKAKDIVNAFRLYLRENPELF